MSVDYRSLVFYGIELPSDNYWGASDAVRDKWWQYILCANEYEPDSNILFGATLAACEFGDSVRIDGRAFTDTIFDTIDLAELKADFNLEEISEPHFYVVSHIY